MSDSLPAYVIIAANGLTLRLEQHTGLTWILDLSQQWGTWRRVNEVMPMSAEDLRALNDAMGLTPPETPPDQPKGRRGA